jgi:hypothetical protein
MRDGSFHPPPVDAEAADQLVDGLLGFLARALGQMGVAGGGEDRAVAQDLLDLQQIDPGFDQMRG